jgi:hypothetical protein
LVNDWILAGLLIILLFVFFLVLLLFLASVLIY